MSSARCQAHCWPWHGTSALAIPGGSGTCHGFPGQFWVSWLLVMHRPGWLGSAGESGLTVRWKIGRASCRGRGEISVVAVLLKKKIDLDGVPGPRDTHEGTVRVGRALLARG